MFTTKDTKITKLAVQINRNLRGLRALVVRLYFALSTVTQEQRRGKFAPAAQDSKDITKEFTEDFEKVVLCGFCFLCGEPSLRS